ncbi:MAG: GNAT family N-acetyltransferase [Actinomycetota bacterium]|nr:GNAT family N-acetyltransferase [Actinomycetota bacterium]
MADPEPFTVALSPLDEERFGVVTARASGVTAERVTQVLDFCAHHGVEFAIVRCATNDLRAVQELEDTGFRLMDTLVYYGRGLEDPPPPMDDGPVRVRPAAPGDEMRVRAIAARGFTGYVGHYHADERLDRAACDEVYASWAYRSCIESGVADGVLVAELDGDIVGFSTIRIKDDQEAEGVLDAVDPAVRRRGIYRQLGIARIDWCRRHGLSRLVVPTQLANPASQRGLVRLGFAPQRSSYTFHWWRDQPRGRRTTG